MSFSAYLFFDIVGFLLLGSEENPDFHGLFQSKEWRFDVNVLVLQAYLGSQILFVHDAPVFVMSLTVCFEGSVTQLEIFQRF